MESGTEHVKVLQSVTLLLTTDCVVRGETLARVIITYVKSDHHCLRYKSSIESTQIFRLFCKPMFCSFKNNDPKANLWKLLVLEL